MLEFNRITEIGSATFMNCTSLTNITIPNSVTKICSDAFSGCSALTNVTIPNGVKSIGSEAFYGCANLTHITIPSSVSSIGDSAFANCTNLNHVFFTGSEAAWSEISKSACSFPYSKITYHYNTTAEKSLNIVGSIVPTCTELGNVVYHCKICDAEYSAQVFSCGHRKGEVISVTEATCTTQGYTTYRCALCSETFTADFREARGHKVKAISKVAPTCTEQGFTNYCCEICGYEYKDDYLPIEHKLQNNVCVLGGWCASAHPYANNTDQMWEVQRPGASFVTVTFSQETVTENEYDWIYIYDVMDNVIGKYSGEDLAGVSITVPGDVVKIRLVSDSEVPMYGFEVVNVSTTNCVHKDTEITL